MLNRIRTIRKRWLVVTAAAALMAVGVNSRRRIRGRVAPATLRRELGFVQSSGIG